MRYDKLLEQQRKYFRSGVTKEYSYQVNTLKALRKSIIYYEDEINQALMEDLNKSPYETFITEYGLALQQISSVLRDLKGWMKPRVKSVGVTGFPGRAYELVEPYGLTLILSPWNYPLSLAIQPLIGAIAAGNCAVVKPSELSQHTPVISCRTLEEALAFVEEREKPLALYLFTKSKDTQKRVLNQLSFGGACVNDTISHITCDGLVFGGVGESGMGAYHGAHSFETFSHRKGIYKKSSLFEMPMRYQPYSNKVGKMLRFLLR